MGHCPTYSVTFDVRFSSPLLRRKRSFGSPSRRSAFDPRGHIRPPLFLPSAFIIIARLPPFGPSVLIRMVLLCQTAVLPGRRWADKVRQ
jgi:hypothetical protein